MSGCDNRIIEGARLKWQLRRQHSAECVDIDNESNQVP